MNRNTFFVRRAAQTATLGALALLAWSCRGDLPPLYTPVASPSTDIDFTSTREVTTLFLSGDELWAGTTGGALHRSRDGQWRKYTAKDGLPANEIRGFRKDKSGAIIAITPRGDALFDGASWRLSASATVEKPKPRRVSSRVTASALWRGIPVEATLGGLRLDTTPDDGAEPKTPDEAEVEILALPDGVGTHVSALLPREQDVCAALFGDGLWLTDGKKWNPAPPTLQVPAAARDITALAGDKNPQWLGTRRAGIWQRQDSTWQQQLQANEPFEHNAQAMVTFKGALFVSTLEDGLSILTGTGWRHEGAETLSSNAPRQMVTFRDTLYLRNGGGQVDAFDGAAWSRNAFTTLPRKKALSIAADGDHLFVGQWGGWSEWDGHEWTHFLNLPALQGVPSMALLPDGNTLWFATRSKGIAEIERSSGKIRWHDERLGLPDDWITCLTKVGTDIFAGTFVGGLAHWDGTHWQVAPELRGENVTALEGDGSGGLFVATRHGVWHRAADGTLRPLRERAGWLQPEAQALCPVPEGLWIGTRTGLEFLSGQSHLAPPSTAGKAQVG